MEKEFRHEQLIDDGDALLWWTIGLDVCGDNVRPFVSYGGIADADAPIAVMKAAVAKWSEWLATL